MPTDDDRPDDRVDDRAPTATHLPFALVVLFVASGAAALIYEVVWFQLLEFVIGSTAVSLGVLLASFMGGMCVGSLWLPRRIPESVHPLRAYAALEVGIAASAVVMPVLIRLLAIAYPALAIGGPAGVVVRAVVCAVCLVVPTALMGATLPVVSRWVAATVDARRVGVLYGANSIGAVVGCAVSAFVLLRLTDAMVATAFAAAVNIAIAASALALARGTAGANRMTESPVIEARSAGPPTPNAWAIYVAIGLSGLTALGAEVVWTRQLSLMLGGSVYTFALILSVFLGGLGIGSVVAAAMVRSGAPAWRALVWCQLAQAGGLAWASMMIADYLPYWPVNPTVAFDPWPVFQMDLARCAFAVLPGAMLWGASFPLAVASVRAEGDPGRSVGRLLGANTLGSIVGALGVSTLAIPLMGTVATQQLLIGVTMASAVVLIVGATRESRFGVVATAAAVAVLAAALVLAKRIDPLPDGLIAYGRLIATRPVPKMLYVGEGMNSTVAVSQLGNARNFHVAGKIEASTQPKDLRLERMLGHLSALAHPGPKSVLVVGFGAGVTAGTFVTYPGIERIVICEIEPLVPTHIGPYFAAVNDDVAHDPRVRIVYDDARHFILTTDESFDVITSDPIHPWVKGSASLYTREYFQLLKAHLKPGGLVSQWVPLYESTMDVVKSEAATFFDVFPAGTVWANVRDSRGYDVALIGRDGPGTIDVDSVAARLARPENRRAAESLREVGFASAMDLLATYGGRASDLRPWLVDAQINRDRNLRLQYLAGLGLNAREDATIYDQMREYRRFPTDLFAGSTASVARLKGVAGPWH